MAGKIRILIIEDNRQYTDSLKHMIRMSTHLEFVAAFPSAESYINEAAATAALNFDIVLLDVHLPEKNGLQLIPTLQANSPACNILVLTQDSDFRTTLEAVRLGASGYLLKSAPIASIRETIAEIHEGGCIIDPQLSRIVLRALAGSPSQEDDGVLSSREQEVLKLLSMGYVKKEVAEQLGIGYRTVAQHTENIYQKLQVPNIAAAVAAAIRKGII
ncbi:response regulator [Haloferula chungangensis]|uniref:Response regulator n=1 Tax=Haloferula chungangensis TaxID=1048331 RepID=A0ABW2L9S7_9BACT